MSSHKRRSIPPSLFFLPVFVYFFALTIFPTLFNLWVSLTDMNLTQAYRGTHFVGLSNFAELISSETFWNVLRVTVQFTLMSLAAEFGLGMFLAHIFNREIRGIRLFRTILVIPVLMPPLTVGYTFRYIYQPSFGLINIIPFFRGINLLGPNLALYGAIMMDIWQWTPFVFLVFLSGLRSLPQAPFEAARIDGASTLRSIWSIELPMLKELIKILLLIRGLDALQTFTQIWTLTRGGPGFVTSNLPIQIYKVGFYTYNTSTAAALSLLLAVVADVMILALWYGMKK